MIMFKSIMKKFKSKKLSFFAALMLLIALPVSVWAAWGPSRPVFDYNNPAQQVGSMDGPVFNSFINAPNYGDERNFTTSSQSGAANWTSRNAVAPGDEVDVRVYVHNNANEATNTAEYDHKGIARNTRVRVDVPEGLANGFDVTGYVSADNATPAVVYDSTELINDSQAFGLTYKPGSARIYNNGPWTNGIPLSDDVVSAGGAQIGYDALNGEFPGCFDYKAVVIITLKVEAPELDFSKQVTTPGASEWHEEITAGVGDTVSWLISFENTGSAVMNNVTIRDEVPTSLDIVPGSITAFDVNRPDGEVLPDTALSAGGVNLGNYGVNGGGYVRFRTVINESALDECLARNVAYGRGHNVPEQSDDAVVVIEDCVPVEPVYSCDLLEMTNIGGNTYQFETQYTAEGGAMVQNFSYNFGDGSEALLTDMSSVEYTYSEPGTYVASVTVNVLVDGEVQEATSQACTASTKIAPVTPDEPVKPVTPSPAQPTMLPVTGVGSLIGLFAATSAAGTIGYRLLLTRRG